MVEIDDTESFTVGLEETFARGIITSFDAPASAKNGEMIKITTNFRNTGSVSGRFKVQLLFSGKTVSAPLKSVAAGGDATIEMLTYMLDHSITVTLNLIREL